MGREPIHNIMEQAGHVRYVAGYIRSARAIKRALGDTEQDSFAKVTMSQRHFYRVLLWLPLVVPIVLAPAWLIPGVSASRFVGVLLYIVTTGAVQAAAPYAVLALWTDRWLRFMPVLERRLIRRRVLLLPVQFVPLFGIWHTLVSVATGRGLGLRLLTLWIFGSLWVLLLGYAYVGLAYALVRLARWTGFVRPHTRQAPADAA